MTERRLESRPKMDYKAIWDANALVDARGAICTGATDETFEASGRLDADWIRRFLPPDARVLNIGCGVGRVEKYLAPLVGEMVGVDISGEMISRARERLASFPNVSLHVLELGDFLTQFADGSFDLVFSLLVLQHLEREDAFRYLMAARRLLVPTGRLYVQFPNFLSPEYTRAFRSDIYATERSPGRVRTYTEPEVQHMLMLAGFRVIDLRHAGGLRSDAEMFFLAETT